MSTHVRFMGRKVMRVVEFFGPLTTPVSLFCYWSMCLLWHYLPLKTQKDWELYYNIPYRNPACVFRLDSHESWWRIKFCFESLLDCKKEGDFCATWIISVCLVKSRYAELIKEIKIRNYAKKIKWKKYIMLSVLEVITISKWSSSLPYGLLLVPVKCLLQYSRKPLLFYIFIERSTYLNQISKEESM